MVKIIYLTTAAVMVLATSITARNTFLSSSNFASKFWTKFQENGQANANKKLFKKLVNKFKKKYATKEARLDAYNAFLDNLEKIAANNNMTLDNPNFDLSSWEFKRFQLASTMTSEEFHNNAAKRRFYGLDASADVNSMSKYWPVEIPDWIRDCAPTLSCGLGDVEFPWECNSISTFDEPEGGYPTNVDWSTTDNRLNKLAVTPVKDQGLCGSCYSFAGTGAIEGVMLMQDRVRNNLQGGHNHDDTDTWKGLSEQELVDCMDNNRQKFGPFVNHGCNGGWPSNIFLYATVRESVRSESVKPYTSGDTRESYPGSCEFLEGTDHSDNGLNGFVPGVCYTTAKNDEDSLMKSLYHYGPVAIIIDASTAEFQLYKTGVINPGGCSTNNLNHAVLLVGYGEEDGEKYWKIKNSWGDWWGDDGYIKLARNGQNTCGVTSVATFITGESYFG